MLFRTWLLETIATNFVRQLLTLPVFGNRYIVISLIQDSSTHHKKYVTLGVQIAILGGIHLPEPPGAGLAH